MGTRKGGDSAPETAAGRLESIECGAESRRGDGWRAYLTEDEPPRVIVYCPTCAGREFGTTS